MSIEMENFQRELVARRVIPVDAFLDSLLQGKAPAPHSATKFPYRLEETLLALSGRPTAMGPLLKLASVYSFPVRFYMEVWRMGLVGEEVVSLFLDKVLAESRISPEKLRLLVRGIIQNGWLERFTTQQTTELFGRMGLQCPRELIMEDVDLFISVFLFRLGGKLSELEDAGFLTQERLEYLLTTGAAYPRRGHVHDVIEQVVKYLIRNDGDTSMWHPDYEYLVPAFKFLHSPSSRDENISYSKLVHRKAHPVSRLSTLKALLAAGWDFEEPSKPKLFYVNSEESEVVTAQDLEELRDLSGNDNVFKKVMAHVYHGFRFEDPATFMLHPDEEAISYILFKGQSRFERLMWVAHNPELVSDRELDFWLMFQDEYRPAYVESKMSLAEAGRHGKVLAESSARLARTLWESEKTVSKLNLVDAGYSILSGYKNSRLAVEMKREAGRYYRNFLLGVTDPSEVPCYENIARWLGEGVFFKDPMDLSHMALHLVKVSADHAREFVWCLLITCKASRVDRAVWAYTLFKDHQLSPLDHQAGGQLLRLLLTAPELLASREDMLQFTVELIHKLPEFKLNAVRGWPISLLANQGIPARKLIRLTNAEALVEYLEPHLKCLTEVQVFLFNRLLDDWEGTFEELLSLVKSS